PHRVPRRPAGGGLPVAAVRGGVGLRGAGARREETAGLLVRAAKAAAGPLQLPGGARGADDDHGQGELPGGADAVDHGYAGGPGGKQGGWRQADRNAGAGGEVLGVTRWLFVPAGEGFFRLMAGLLAGKRI